MVTPTVRAEAAAFLGTLDDRQRAAAAGDFADDATRRWIEYRPRPRPGLSLAEMPADARKAAHRLLATALSPPAYAQAVAVMAWEEVLDRRESWVRGRHRDDYRVIVFGTPGDDRWAWRFEGHHLSVTMTVIDGVVAPAPLFLGANPARVDVAGHAAMRPFAAEEDLGRALLLAMTPEVRRRAVVEPEPPWDIRSGTRPSAGRLEPPGIARSDLRTAERDLLDELIGVYLTRLPDDLAARLRPEQAYFAWEGPAEPGVRHYYRIQGDDLLIEFDMTAGGDGHAHSVLRRPDSDFGGDILAAHHAHDHA
jgi:hypothetical protein